MPWPKHGVAPATPLAEARRGARDAEHERVPQMGAWGYPPHKNL